jgi:hypothetical protein
MGTSVLYFLKKFFEMFFQFLQFVNILKPCNDFKKKEHHKPSAYPVKLLYDNPIIGGTQIGSPDKNRDKLFNKGLLHLFLFCGSVQ